MTPAALVDWGLRASLVASMNTAHLSDALLRAMADAAIANPITATDDGVWLTMAVEVSLAWFETGGQLRNDPAGSNDNGRSFCFGQVYLPNGAHTAEGWSGRELVDDPAKCATVVVRLVKQSIVAGPADCGLCVYARGPNGLPGHARYVEAKQLSDHRMNLAKRLLREVAR